MSTFITKLVCDIHHLAEQTKDEKTKEQLLIMWKNVCHYKRAKEAINCSSHPTKTITESIEELSILSSAANTIAKIILK